MKIAAKEVEGIGLAIPVTRAVPIMNELEKYGKVRRPYVGIELRSLNEIPNYYWSKTLHLPGNVTEELHFRCEKPFARYRCWFARTRCDCSSRWETSSRYYRIPYGLI